MQLSITDFVSVGPVEPEVVDAYRGRVPDDLVEVWERFGYGSFAGGFLRVINPALYEAEVGDCIGKTQGDGVAIPVMTTALGDLITWEPSNPGFVGLLYRLNDGRGLGSVLDSLLLMVLDEELLEWFRAEIYPDAVAAHGPVAYDESFVFVPLLSLGGKAKVENLQKRDTITSIQVAVEFQGVIGH